MPRTTHIIVRPVRGSVWLLGLVVWFATRALSAQEIPHAQDKPPGPALSPAEAIAKMEVPEGFQVELVASEPDIMNPVAMTIDERGRFWITESFEYPRHEPGPGRDRLKVLEDTDGDGKVDKVDVFLDGLNIPSGVAVGHGGVWVANAPDLLFVQDTNGDGQADRQEVVVTGFGRDDTHELPNSLTWGPDGWLYGLNGVFNPCHVRYVEGNPNYRADHPGWAFDTAMYRIHPVTREFEIFTEGTSNPWGIAFNDRGDAFISACVIDHLWHLVETGYYHRQAGAYPPATWKIESIVRHKHQKAAYCGITWFDSEAYPPEYRQRLYMGNIHGGCINVDEVERQGATYFGKPNNDFLTANDAWFMPVVQKTGPDGSLYILDWYDRYHCYQDANRDPGGIDRGRGRLYRVRYGKSPYVAGQNLGKLKDEALIARLDDGNVYVRETAQRLLQERSSPALIERLEQLVLSPKTPARQRAHATFALVGGNVPLQYAPVLAGALAAHTDPLVRAWGVRLATRTASRLEQAQKLDEGLEAALSQIAMTALEDADADVRVQGLVFVTRLSQLRKPYLVFAEALGKALIAAPDDGLTSRLGWQALKAYCHRDPQQSVNLLGTDGFIESVAGRDITPRLVEWMLARSDIPAQTLGLLLQTLSKLEDPTLANSVLAQLATLVQNRELTGEALQELRSAVSKDLDPWLADRSHPLHLNTILLMTSWRDDAGFQATRALLSNPETPLEQRIAGARALVAAQDSAATGLIVEALGAKDATAPLQSALIDALGAASGSDVAVKTLAAYPQLDPAMQSRLIELLTQRAEWAEVLLSAIAEKQLPATVININQARRLQSLNNARLSELLAEHWGQVREGRSANRDEVIADMRRLIRRNPGDAFAGEKVFARVCGQCHKMYGQGAEVGPDLTGSGRNDYTQLLSNVFDPSLVIGASYRSYTLATTEGRVINGLLVEDSPTRVVLKVQGGKQEVVPRADIEEFQVSPVSLMPEQLERQITPQEMVDLFAFLTLDRHPSDKSARRLAGVDDYTPRESEDSATYLSIVHEISPHVVSVTSGLRGVGLLAEHFGRKGVVRLHPHSEEDPAVLVVPCSVPAGGHAKLRLPVSHDAQGDWRLRAMAGDRELFADVIGPQTCRDGWREVEIDLSEFAGQTVPVELRCEANGWSWEYAYLGAIEFLTE